MTLDVIALLLPCQYPACPAGNSAAAVDGENSYLTIKVIDEKIPN